MYLIIITLTILLLAFVLKFSCEEDSWGEVIGFIGLFVVGLVLLSFIFTIMANHAFIDAKIAENNLPTNRPLRS